MTIDRTNSTCCVSCPSCTAAEARIREAEAKVASLVPQALAAVRGQEAAEERERRLEEALREGASHLLAMSGGAHNCAGCGLLYQGWMAALAPTPEAEKKGGEE